MKSILSIFSRTNNKIQRTHSCLLIDESTIDYKELKSKIISARKQRRMSQREVASKMGISYRTYSDFENMVKPQLTPKYFHLFASVVGVNAKDFFVSDTNFVPSSALLNAEERVIHSEIAYLAELKSEIEHRISLLKEKLGALT